MDSHMFQFRAPCSRLTATMLLASLACGLGGCYIPNGGWTLRSGLDLRTMKKPSCFTELVDTRWDEYNRVAQANSSYGMTSSEYCPPMEGAPPGMIISSDTSKSGSSDSRVVQTSQQAASPNAPAPRAAKPTGAWLFR